MDTKALERFCPWARVQLIEDVRRRCLAYGLDNTGRAAAGPGSDVVAGRVLTADERVQRDALYARVESQGYDAFCEAEAYGWFNRLAAIRYMELHGYLPCGVRVLSSADGSFDPDCLKSPATLDLPDLDAAEAADLALAGDHEALFRRILVAQCNQLADALPTMFGRVGEADALTLPDGLLQTGEHNVLYRMVTDVPEEAWEDVEVLGWAYQFYNAERKDDFFNSKRKAAPEDIAPATQLFTPEWIVRYMVENSLGRLWMLNHPQSQLRDRMEYYVEPDAASAEDFIRVSGPEDITICDPACGSGHILSYAFELLFAMYEEDGYRERDIPSLILSKNLSGMEIDPRAAQIASLVLALRAREHDRRFFGRGVTADVTVLADVPLEEGDLDPRCKGLTETLAHLGEVGSLLAPAEADLDNLRAALAGCEGDLFSEARANRVAEALDMCESLARRFDVVVANPPYMGSSNFNLFMSKWVKANYPDVKSDLCTCFIERGFNLAKDRGYVAMITASSWMFISSFQAMREKIVANVRITSMIQQSTHGFPFVTVPTTMFVMQPGVSSRMGTYIRLEDFDRPQWQQPRALEAIQNPDCGWLYRRDAQTFTQIPGTPIAYWASEGLLSAFRNELALKDVADLKQGLKTGDNDRFLRFWHETPVSNSVLAVTQKFCEASACRWFPYNKGGQFRRWYGNRDYFVNWANDGDEIKNFVDDAGKLRSRPQSLAYQRREGITWSLISTGKPHFRYAPSGTLFDAAGSSMFCNDEILLYVLALANSSIVEQCSTFMSATLTFEVGQLSGYPYRFDEGKSKTVNEIAESCVDISKTDWDSFETSWDFKRHPLL